jgi:hypothetical protein
MADLILIDRRGDEHPVKLFCKPGHYYSPLPDAKRFDDPAWRERVFRDRPLEMPGIGWRRDAQLELLERFGEQTPLEFPSERPDPAHRSRRRNASTTPAAARASSRARTSPGQRAPAGSLGRTTATARAMCMCPAAA